LVNLADSVQAGISGNDHMNKNLTTIVEIILVCVVAWTPFGRRAGNASDL